jgi:hypothetical protein
VNNKHLYWLAGILFLLGMGMFFYKVVVLKFPITSDDTAQIWDIEVKVHLKPTKGPIKIRLYIPKANSRFSITDEQFISAGYGLGVKLVDSNRQAIWSIRDTRGEQVIFYRGTIRPREAPYTTTQKPPEIDIGSVEFSEAKRIAAQSVIDDAKNKSADIETFVREILNRLNVETSKQQYEQTSILLGKNPNTAKRLAVATQLLVMENIPSRIVNGVQLVDFEREAKYVQWLEVYHGKEWKAYHPRTGQQGMPEDYLAWWRGTQPLIQLTGGKLQSSNTAVSKNAESSVISALRRERATRPVLYEFSLLGLPLDTQAVYRVLLTVPIGVLLLVILRNVIGISTFGTFMPVLIAMAFRETQLLWGILLFILVVGLGLAIRFYLEQLKLLLVPRLAAVLITVIIIMALVSILSHKLGFHFGLSVALFPMVILTMTIERMNIVWEERGAEEAIKQGIGSLFVASLTYLVMNIESLRYMLFMFSELLLVLLAITLLLGRYSGYRLTELYRFKILSKEQS